MLNRVAIDVIPEDGVMFGILTDQYAHTDNTRITNDGLFAIDTFEDIESDLESDEFDDYVYGTNGKILETDRDWRKFTKFKHIRRTVGMRQYRYINNDTRPHHRFTMNPHAPSERLFHFPKREDPVLLLKKPVQELPREEEKDEIITPTTTTTTTTPMPKPPPPKVLGPVTYLSPLKDITDYLEQTVMYQEGTSHLVDALVTARNVGADKDDITVVPVVLSGPSGCGKTEAAKQVRKLLMLENDENHCVYYNFGDFKGNNEINNRIVGVSQGWIGYGDTCLVDKLKAALDYNRVQYEKKKKVKLVNQKDIDEHYPKVIYIHIDELDKAHRDIMDSFNSLLDKGYMKSARGVEFVLPSQTTLFILFTANFGEKLMIQHPDLTYFECAEVVAKSMKLEYNYKNCDMSRLTYIIPFKPLSRDNAKAILKNKLPGFIQKYSQKCKKYSTQIHMSEHDQNAFVERCLNKGYSLELGIRKAEEMMRQDLRAKQDFQLDHMVQNIDTKKVSLPLYPPPELKFNSIEFSDSFSSTQTLSEKNQDMCLALQDSNSALGIKRCLDQKTSIDYLSLTHESMKTPFYGILAPHASVTININNYASDPRMLDKFEKHVEEIAILKKENEELKNSLKRKRDDLFTIAKDPSYHKLSRKVKQKVTASIKTDMTVPPKNLPVDVVPDSVKSLAHCNRYKLTVQEEEEEDEFDSIRSDQIECPVCLEWKPKSLFENKVRAKGKAYSYFNLQNCNTCRRKKPKRMIINLSNSHHHSSSGNSSNSSSENDNS
jgi:hypothetical protein